MVFSTMLSHKVHSLIDQQSPTPVTMTVSMETNTQREAVLHNCGLWKLVDAPQEQLWCTWVSP